MSEEPSQHRTQIIVAMITVVGGILAAIAANIDWSDDKISSGTNPGGSTSEPVPPVDSLVGFYERDGLGGSSPVLKISHVGGSEYKLMVTNHGWPWEAAVKREGQELTGPGWFPDSQATIRFEGEIQADGSISSEYHFRTKGDGSLANGRIDRHIWTKR